MEYESGASGRKLRGKERESERRRDTRFDENDL